MTNFGLKKVGLSLDSFADGDKGADDVVDINNQEVEEYPGPSGGDNAGNE
jgi:hypothetical protein